MTDKIFIRTRSHRATAKLDRALGRHPQFYWTWKTAGTIAEIEATEYPLVKDIPGITRYRGKDVPMRCWND